MVIHVTVAAMPVGADVRGWFAVVPAFVAVVPLRCMGAAPAGASLAATQAVVARPVPAAPQAVPREPDPPAPQAMPKAEEPTDRVALVPAAAPRARAPTLADEVVVKAVASGQQAFLSCWARARRSAEPPLEAKVRLHLEVDPDGQVTVASSDSDSPALERCLAVVARGLQFPAPGRAAVVDLPLLFQ
jgi:hypothetical protein